MMKQKILFSEQELRISGSTENGFRGVCGGTACRCDHKISRPIPTGRIRLSGRGITIFLALNPQPEGAHGGLSRKQENTFGHKNWRASKNIGSGQEENSKIVPNS